MEIWSGVHLVAKIILKILELVCVIAAIVLCMVTGYAISFKRGEIFFGDGTLMLAAVITPLLIIFTLDWNRIGFLFEAIVNFIFGVFHIVAGGITFGTYHDFDFLETLLDILGLREPYGRHHDASVFDEIARKRPQALALGAMHIVGGGFYLIDWGYTLVLYAKAKRSISPS
ncbi:hypothetical protein SK128_006526 [Halocaridina rubra]|uniref:Uncharacterized protein n=1 Tax=Halocaridina rubra TaxID=373956 RepID=A0AAN8X6X3_HALRR